MVHLCETCAQKYLSSVEVGGIPAMPEDDEADNEAERNWLPKLRRRRKRLRRRPAPGAGSPSSSFAASGGWGVRAANSSFHDDLVPLLESIHQETSMLANARRRPLRALGGTRS